MRNIMFSRSQVHQVVLAIVTTLRLWDDMMRLAVAIIFRYWIVSPLLNQLVIYIRVVHCFSKTKTSAQKHLLF